MIGFEDLKSWKRVSCLIVVVGSIQFIVLTAIAMIFFPGGYIFHVDTFSELGFLVIIGMDNTISRVLFVIACNWAAISLIPFWIVMPTLFVEKKITKMLSYGASTFGLISAPFLSLLSIFPTDSIFYDAHSISTNIFFLLFAVAISLDSAVIFLKDNYHNIYGIIGIIFAILIALYTFHLLDVINEMYVRYLLQKIIVYCFILWASIQTPKIWKEVGPK